MFLTVDPAGTEQPPPTFADDVRTEVERYRLAGYESYVPDPDYASVDLEIEVCAQPTAFVDPVITCCGG